MKKLFHLKMEEAAWVATHVKEFNMIVNQLSSVKIEFEDEVQALILLASLPNSWEPMKVPVNNSIGNAKLKFNEASMSLALDVENRRRNHNKNQNRGKDMSKS